MGFRKFFVRLLFQRHLELHHTCMRILVLIRVRGKLVTDLQSFQETVSVRNVVTQTAINPLSPFNVDVYGFECKNQPATLN